jgi:uncharacterized protein (TIGR03067 family)
MNYVVAVGFLFGSLGIGVVAPADEPKGGADKKELDQFQGTWEVVGLEWLGRVSPQSSLKALPRSLTIKGNRFTMTWHEGHSRNPEDWKKGKIPSYVNEVRKSGTLKVNSITEPRSIDFTYDARGGGPGRWDLEGKTLKGIYRWEDGKLVVCLGPYLGSFAGDRPRQFKTAAHEAKGLGVFIDTFKKR